MCSGHVWPEARHGIGAGSKLDQVADVVAKLLRTASPRRRDGGQLARSLKRAPSDPISRISSRTTSTRRTCATRSSVEAGGAGRYNRTLARTLDAARMPGTSGCWPCAARRAPRVVLAMRRLTSWPVLLFWPAPCLRRATRPIRRACQEPLRCTPRHLSSGASLHLPRPPTCHSLAALQRNNAPSWMSRCCFSGSHARYIRKGETRAFRIASFQSASASLPLPRAWSLAREARAVDPGSPTGAAVLCPLL
jgi:hypothetical protein